MKKRVMLVMAIVMVLGSVKAMATSADLEMAEGKWAAAEENMAAEDIMNEIAIGKTEAAEEDMLRAKALDKIRDQITTLKERGSELDEVRVGKEIVSRGQAIFAAEADLAVLTKKFDKKYADDVSRILEISIQSAK
ncbi:hypothetical protein [Bdellovibrio sp. HCB288]|uniref:hypothetical protein n=1 Tax=Bdellovibrio sp. HCB288 TaxID=3394355 RepID=UPI0039B44A9A